MRTLARLRWSLPPLLAALLVGVLAGLSAFTAGYADAPSYLRDDPRVCTNCHVMRDPYDAWRGGPHHAAATCNDCHVSTHPIGHWVVKADQGLRHSAVFTLDRVPERIRMIPRSVDVVQRNCVRCHAALVEDVVHGAGDDGRPFDCIRCHASVGHGPTR